MEVPGATGVGRGRKSRDAGWESVGIGLPVPLALFPWEPGAAGFALPSAPGQGNSIYPEIPGVCSHWERSWCHEQSRLAPESVTFPTGMAEIGAGMSFYSFGHVVPILSFILNFQGLWSLFPLGSLHGAVRALQHPRLAPESAPFPLGWIKLELG